MVVGLFCGGLVVVVVLWSCLCSGCLVVVNVACVVGGERGGRGDVSEVCISISMCGEKINASCISQVRGGLVVKPHNCPHLS